MTTGQKTAISLLITVLVCAGFAVASFAGLFSVIETRFYQPSVIRGINRHIEETAAALEEYNAAQMQRFASFTENPSVKRSMLVNQSSQDIFDRSSLAALLQNETTGLLGIRLIDAAGKRIHYSTFNSDIQNRRDFAVSYSSYNEETDYPYTLISTPENGKARLIIDAGYDRLIYSFPFYDSYEVYRGTILFYTTPSALSRFLVSKSLMRITDRLTLIGSPSESVAEATGIVLDLPAVISGTVVTEIQKRWNSQQFTPEKLTESGENTLLLFSKPVSSYGFFGQVYAENLFIFSDNIKILLLVTVFITAFLAVFLFFNLRQDRMVVIRDKIRKFQYGVIKEYLEKNEEIDWSKVSREIIYRKHDVSTEIKKSLGRQVKKHTQEVETLLDKSWDEILAAFGKKETNAENIQPSTKTGTDEIKRLLEQLISNGGIQIAAPIQTAVKSAKTKSAIKPESSPLPAEKAPEQTSQVEELEELNELDEVEELADEIEEAAELDEAEELDEVEEIEEAVEIEKLDEIDELDELNEVEELADEVEEVADDVEEAAELDEADELADAVEEAVEIEKLDEIDEVDELSEVEELADDVEEVAELDEADEIKEVVEIEKLDEVDEVDELSEVEEIAEADETEKLDEIDELDELNEVEELADDVEEVAELDETEEIEEVAEAVELSEVEEIDEADEAEKLDEFLIKGQSYKSIVFSDAPIDILTGIFSLEPPAAQSSIEFIDEVEFEPVAETAPEPPVELDSETEQNDETEQYEEAEQCDDVEELGESVPYSFFSNVRASAAAFFSKPLQPEELAAAEETDIITEEDGIFKIRQEIKPAPIQDKTFKQLVDSVLK